MILIVLVIFNNAPSLKLLRDKYSIRNLIKKMQPKKWNSADVVKDDEANWSRIPTKVKMDEILSTDVSPDESFSPDKPSKGEKQ